MSAPDPCTDDRRTWSSIEEAPVALWCHFARLVEILRRASETSGKLHEFEFASPNLVQLNEAGNGSLFGFGSVVYSYARDIGEGSVFEYRDGLTTAYTSRGTVGLVSRGSENFSTDPLVVALELPAPPHPERN